MKYVTDQFLMADVDKGRGDARNILAVVTEVNIYYKIILYCL